jgi:hypothetical protein
MTKGRLIAACLAVLALLPACSWNGPPNSLFEAAGYHVKGDKVYYLNAFPGKAFQIDGVDVASFTVFDETYAKDASTVYLDGAPLVGADPATFELLDRPDFTRDKYRVYQRDRVLSDDPANFELLDGELSKDSHAVYWSDGRVLSEDPEHFAIISNVDYYLFTQDSNTVHVNGNPIAGADPATFRVIHGAYAQDGARVYYFTDEMAHVDAGTFQVLESSFAKDASNAYWMGKPIPGADPATFRVLNANFECTTDARHAYYRQTVIAGADPSTFPQGRAATNCSDTSISFAER